MAVTRIAVVGATGSNGRLAVDYALSLGLKVRAGTRSPRRLAPREGVDVVKTDALVPDQVASLIDGCDALILAHGDDAKPENNYRIIAAAVAVAPPEMPIALMSAISVTQDVPAFSDVLDWRRRGERLLARSRRKYAIIRPGWFDGHSPGDDRIVLEQGDRTPLRSMRGVRRRHIAEALVEAVRTEEASSRTVEIFSEPGEPVIDVHALFGECAPDPVGSLDGVSDPAGLPLSDEPARVREDLGAYDQRFL